jgi:hypothetical protein
MRARTPHPLVRAHEVRLGVSIPEPVGLAGRSLEWALARCLDLGMGVVDVTLDTLEVVLGAPVPTAPLEPPPADGLAFGLLELEEDVLRDSYELAKRTFDVQVRAWRATVPLAPLADLRQVWQTAGVSIEVVTVPDLVLWSDDEVDYACRAARATGARALTTHASLAGPRRLGPLASRQDLQLSFSNDRTTGAAELARILQDDDSITVAVDIDAWTTGDHGSPVPFLKDYAPRISYVRLKNVDNTHIGDVLRLMRDNAWTFPAILAIDATGEAWLSAVEQAIDHCNAVLE